MKTRHGFISNSSSSSFIILAKDKELTENQLKQTSIEAWEKYLGETIDDSFDDHYVNTALEYAKEGKYIFLIKSIEYGAEECVEDLVRDLIEKLNNKENLNLDFSFERSG